MSLKGERQYAIAKKFNVTPGWVSQIISNFTKQNDEDLAIATGLQFVAEYTKNYDYIDMKKRELEKLLELTRDEKLKEKIIMDQIAVSEILLYSISQKRFMQAVQEDVNAFAFFKRSMETPSSLEDKFKQ